MKKHKHKLAEYQANLGGDLVWFVEVLGSQNRISMGQGMNSTVATLFR